MIRFVERGIPNLILLVLVATACGSSEATPTDEVRERFSARRESETGLIVAWQGYTEGYQPGEEAIFGVTFTNETEQTWRGRFCLQLLQRQGSHVTVASLEQRPFTLQSDLGFSTDLVVKFPAHLADGAYGLSLVVRSPQGPMVDLVPIQVGETAATYGVATQRDMDAALEACPAVEDGE
jgi:hypothetical protein